MLVLDSRSGEGGRGAIRGRRDRRLRAVLLRAERPAAGRRADRKSPSRSPSRRDQAAPRDGLLRLPAPLSGEFLEPGIPAAPERRACARIRGPGGARSPERHRALSDHLTGAAPAGGPGSGLSFPLGSGRLDVVTPEDAGEVFGPVEADPAEAGFAAFAVRLDDVDRQARGSTRPGSRTRRSGRGSSCRRAPPSGSRSPSSPPEGLCPRPPFELPPWP